MSMMFFWSKMSMMFVMPIKLLIDFHFPVSFKTSDKLWKDIFFGFILFWTTQNSLRIHIYGSACTWALCKPDPNMYPKY